MIIVQQENTLDWIFFKTRVGVDAYARADHNAKRRSLLSGASLFVIILILILFAPQTSARAQMLNPFAGQIGAMGMMGAAGAQNFAPYGARSGTMAHILQSENGLMMSRQSSTPNLMNGLSRLLGIRSRGRRLSISQDHLDLAEGLMGEVPSAVESLEAEGLDVDVMEGLVELVVGACAGGAFIGAFAAATAAPAVAPAAGAVIAAAATPFTVVAFATAMGIGCGIGIAMATASVGAVLGFRAATQ